MLLLLVVAPRTESSDYDMSPQYINALISPITPPIPDIHVYNHRKFESEPTNPAHPSKSPYPVLRLQNEGNSCWVAACLQLLYCAHVHSNYKLFTFVHKGQCVQVSI